MDFFCVFVPWWQNYTFRSLLNVEKQQKTTLEYAY